MLKIVDYDVQEQQAQLDDHVPEMLVSLEPRWRTPLAMRVDAIPDGRQKHSPHSKARARA